LTLALLLTQPCTITRRAPAGTVDEFGNEQTTETTASTVCELQQRQRGENPAEISSTDWLLILPADAALHASDTVTIDDQDYEVRGEPWTVRNPRTALVSHVEATVRRVTPATGSS
jgi:hypothetical protein